MGKKIIMRKRNPNDATMRNIHAVKDRLELIIRHIHLLDKTMDAVVSMVSGLVKRVEKLERKRK